jgi:tetratricopeptide (TPR) repeat protein
VGFRSVFLVLALGAVTGAVASDYYPYIAKSVAIPGMVKGLALAKEGSQALFVLVSSNGKPKPTDKQGIHVFDVRDAGAPQPIGYVPVLSPIGMDLAPDRKTLFVYSRFFHGYDPKPFYGISVFDSTDPANLRLVSRKQADVFQVRLAEDGKYLLVGGTRTGDFFSVFLVTDSRELRQIASVKTKWNSITYGILQNPGTSTWLVRSSGEQVFGYDISSPAAPKLLFEKSLPMGFPVAVDRAGVYYLQAGRELILGAIAPEVRRYGALFLGLYDGSSRIQFGEDGKTAYVPLLDKKIVVLDVSNPRAPARIATYSVPDYPGSVLPLRGQTLLYAGLVGSLAVIDPSKAEATAESLTRAHAAALRLYQRRDRASQYTSVEDALNILEAGGVRKALEADIQGLSTQRLAGIVNDYGFLLAQQSRFGDAIGVYQRAIELDPGRAVAYLNLGDARRALLGEADTWEEKRRLAEQARDNYMTHQKRGGRISAAIDGFLSLNPADTPQATVCEYIAAYANQGRLTETFGSGRRVKRAQGKGTIRVELSTQGSARMPFARLIDNEAEQRVPDNDWVKEVSTVESTDETDDDAGVNQIAVVLFADGHHLLSYNEGGVLHSSSPIGFGNDRRRRCRFDTQVTEIVGPGSENPGLCRMVLAGRRPPYLEFSESYSVGYQELRAAGYYDTSDVAAGKVDFLNNGKPALVLRLQYAFGGGRGCDYEFFELLEPGGEAISKSRARQQLLDLQGVGVKPHVRHPVPCGGNETGWFTYRGVTFYETRYRDDRPDAGLDKIHRIVFIKDGKPRDACVFDFRLHTTPR